MARRLLSVARQSPLVAAISAGAARLWRANSTAAEAAAEAAAAAARRKENAASSPGGAECWWLPDPLTGYYRPANQPRIEETDETKPREIKLKQ